MSILSSVKSYILIKNRWDERGEKQYVLNEENINKVTCSDPPAADMVGIISTLTCTFVHEGQLMHLIDI